MAVFHHPHLHCVVSGGGLAPGGADWRASRPHYFLPVRVLSRVFRHKFRALLLKAFERGELEFFGELKTLAEPRTFRGFVAAATAKEWVVYAKRPFGDAACTLKYLARYTHRVAIANSRLSAYQDGRVTFQYKDYAHGSRQRTMTLAANEFIRRFLVHVLPDGFMRIRSYGYLANRCRREKLAACRRLLGVGDPSATDVAADAGPPVEQDAAASEPQEVRRCPACQTGRLHVVETLKRRARRYDPAESRSPYQAVPLEDSS